MFTLLTAATAAVVSTTPPVGGLLLAAIGLPLHALPVPAQHITEVVGHVAGLQHHDRQSDQTLADLQHFHCL